MITFLISPHSFHATLNFHCVPYGSCLHVVALAITVMKTKRKVTTTTTPTTTTTKTTKVLMPDWLRLSTTLLRLLILIDTTMVNAMNVETQITTVTDALN